MRIIWKLAAVAGLALTLEGCASEVMDYRDMPRVPDRVRAAAEDHTPQQCVPYAREHSGVKIYGDAYTWWDKAAGHYPRNDTPQAGSVMVLNNYAGSDHGHLAVVRRVVSAREIRVDHANWLNDGAVYVNDPVEDVSQDNDWTQVRVYNLRTGGWGLKVYPVQGFIGSGGKGSDLVAGGDGGGHMAATAFADDIK